MKRLALTVIVLLAVAFAVAEAASASYTVYCGPDRSCWRVQLLRGCVPTSGPYAGGTVYPPYYWWRCP